MYTASDPLQKIEKDTEEYRDHINTIRPDGKRAWIFAKKPKGRFYQWRNLVSYLLLALMFFGPYVRIHGQPLLLINVLERKFILFGFVFWPQDFYLVVLALLTLILTIVLFTSVFGRIWCGWTCPQTVFMEMVFRKIEYLIEGDFQQQKQLAASPWNANKIIRKGGKIAIFYLISFAIANTFLAYIIGSEELFKIISEPVTQHVGGFIAINLFTVVFFLVFARFREQVCHFACPYGRFQSALVDNDTISVTYDFKRGEKRGTLGARKKAGFSLVAAAEAGGASQAQLSAGASDNPYGDCIDCGSCVVVCPSGIDIRNGIQLECVQCTACIDACNKMMDAVGKPRGLIRYTSYNNVKNGQNSLFKFRTAGYLASVRFSHPATRAQQLPDGCVGNMNSLKVFNKTFEPQKTDIRLAAEFADKGEIRFIDVMTETAAQNFTQVRFMVALKPEAVGTVNLPIEFDILLNGQLLRKRQTVFIAPGK